MPYRKVPLTTDEIYHICSKSIADFTIFSNNDEYERMIETMSFYTIEKPPCKLSLYKKIKEKTDLKEEIQSSGTKKLVEIIAYCLMPTHIHFILKQLKRGGISTFINKILNSYSSYFNLKHKRKGPLWEGRFKNVLVENDDQFIHLTRYIHLNPATSNLVTNPKDWKYSSYREYLGLVKKTERISNFIDYLNMDNAVYEKFVMTHIDYQRKLSQIKKLILE